jgi:putative transposase
MTDAERLAKNARIKQAMKDTYAKRQSQICRVFTCKIQNNKLSEAQKEELKMTFVEAKWIWNAIIRNSDAKIVGENNTIAPWKYDVKPNNIEVWNPSTQQLETRKLKYIQSQMKQCIQSQLCTNIKTLSSLKKQGKKVGRVKFQTECKKLHIKQLNNFKIYKGRSAKLPNVHGKVQIGGLKQFQKDYESGILDIACAEILNTPKGYYVTFTTYIDKKYLTRKTNKKYNDELGIDFGCSTSLTVSTKKGIGPISSDKKTEINTKVAETDRLKKLQRSLAKKKGSKKGEKKSNNFRKTQKLIQKEYQNISNKKKDKANKTVAELYKYETVIMQNEQLSNWQKTGHGKAISHDCLGLIKSKLISNPNTVILAKNVPTTKMCTKCGQWHDELRVWNRTFVCDCGVKIDRDFHSTKSMIWFYDNNVGVERTKLTLGSKRPPRFKRTELEALALSALDCSSEMNESSQLPTLKQEGPTALAAE